MLGETEASGISLRDGVQQSLLVRVFAGALMAAFVMVLSLAISSEYGFAAFRALEHDVGVAHWVLLVVAVPALVLLGAPVVTSAASDLRRGRLSLHVLFALGTGSAVAVSVVSYARGTGPIYIETAVMLLALYTLGRYLTARAKHRTTSVLGRLLAVPDATYERLAPSRGPVTADAIEEGDRVRVAAGDVIPVDATVREGTSFVDESSLTGEAKPAVREPGDAVYAGTTALDGSLVVDVTAVAEDRRLARVEQMMRRALDRPPRVQRLTDRIMRGLIPGVVVLALATFAGWYVAAGFEKALYTALSVVLITCPCALGIAIPLSLVVGLGEAAREGVLVRDGDTLLDFAQVEALFFDKTGTLTSVVAPSVEVMLDPASTPVVSGAPDAFAQNLDRFGQNLDSATRNLDATAETKRRTLRRAAAIEASTNHPLGRAIQDAADAVGGPSDDHFEVEEAAVIAGAGVQGVIREAGTRQQIAIGNGTMLDAAGAQASDALRALREEAEERGRTALYVVEGDRATALITLEERITDETRAAVRDFQSRGLTLSVITGDRQAAATRLGDELRLPVHASVSPEEKVDHVRDLQAKVGTVAMVGDGINDAAAIAEADIGIARTSGASVAVEAADVALYNPSLRELSSLHALAQRTRRIIYQNLWWTFGYNAVGLGLAVAGLLHPIAAVAIMATSSVFVTWNAFRIGRSSG